ncbi:MAG: methyltransferase domain-containing protein [Alphaproteobacteria bacterium]|nr:methyltransferase domain-containing protein [Alphaproteobacteria bacterium]
MMQNDQTPPQIFDRRRRRARREARAPHFPKHDFLHRRAMLDVVDRLETTKRSFPKAAFFGCGELINELTPACGVEWLASFDDAPSRLPRKPSRAVMDDEALALAPGSLDLIVSVLTLHAANDLVGALAQARMALKPDGLFIATIFGGDTLADAKRAFLDAEIEISGGASMRFAPFGHIKDLGAALQRAGFAMPVADVDVVSVEYRSARNMFADLRGMGETNALARRPRPLARRAAARAITAIEGGAETRFELITLTGWAPAASQPRPLQPGSARHSLAAAIADMSVQNAPGKDIKQ